MKEKLRRLLETEQIKPSLLAEQLDINPAGISHLLAGRNKPGFDLLQKLLRRFPNLNPDWLLLDAPNMYRSETSDSPVSTKPQPASENRNSANTTPSPQTKTSVQPEPELDFSLPPVPTKQTASIAKIVIFYNDQTFEVFSPTRP